MLGAGVGLSAARPASADGAGYGCNDVGVTNVRVCLYDDGDFVTTGGFRQRGLATVNQNRVNLSNHRRHNGGSVNDAAGSLVITVGTVPTDTKFRVRFHDRTDCSSANGYFDHIFNIGNAKFARENLDHDRDGSIGGVQIFLPPA